MTRPPDFRNAPRAKKSFGQNFLTDESFVERIVASANLKETETVLEIGPGTGVLTERLLNVAGDVVVIELDNDLIPFLEERFGSKSNFRLIRGDILKTDIGSLISNDGKAKVVANLPYYISTAVLQHFIESRSRISELILMFQREVVERILAQPGESERGFLTVLVETFFDVEKLFDVPPSAFRPPPKVWSSVVRVTPRQTPEFLSGKENSFEKLVSVAFRQKRKTILNNFKNGAGELRITNVAEFLSQAEIDPQRRSETLAREEWERLFVAYAG